MNTEIMDNGKIIIKKPLSRAGSKIQMQAKMDMKVAIAACSVSEADTNGEKNTPIKVIIE